MGNQPIDIIIRVRKVGQEQGLTRSLSSKTFLGAHVKTAPSRFLNKLANLRATLREPSTWNESQNNEPGFQRPQSQQLQMLSVQDLHSASCSSFSSIGSSASKSEGRSNSILRRSNSVSQVTMGRYTIPDAALWTDSLVCTIREEYVSFKPSPSSSWQQNRNSLNDTDCIGAVLFRAAFIPAATCAEPGLLPEKMLEVEGGIHTRELHAKVWKEGHLYQEGGDLRWWKRRYFLLTGDKLIGYHEQTREQIVLIDLSQLDTVRYYSGHHDYSAPPVYSNDNLHGQVLAGDRDNTYSAVDANQQQLSRSCTDPDSPYVFTLEFRDGRSIALRIDVSDEQMRRVNGNDIESMRNDWIDAIEASHYLLAENQVPSCAPKVELSSGLRLIYAGGFSYAKPGDLRKAMQGARIRTSAVRDIRWISRQVMQLLVDADYVSAFTRIITSLDATIVKSFKAWIPRSEAADKDKLAAISSFAVKTVTTIQRSLDVKAKNFFRSLLASIGGKTLEAATVEAAKIRVQTPGFDISTMETVPKESLPVKKVTDKEPAAPAVDPPSEMAAGVTPAIQVDGVTPTVTPIADVEMCL
ncbi:hypothetical protein BASA83_005456 [Batrachochytrium salamandrivorans]|nr:hypothetical protein BASA83_005456 [Batrachochytrium salamandrivorans]